MSLNTPGSKQGVWFRFFVTRGFRCTFLIFFVSCISIGFAKPAMTPGHKTVVSVLRQSWVGLQWLASSWLLASAAVVGVVVVLLLVVVVVVVGGGGGGGGGGGNFAAVAVIVKIYVCGILRYTYLLFSLWLQEKTTSQLSGLADGSAGLM